jgi:hypothetical protein
VCPAESPCGDLDGDDDVDYDDYLIFLDAFGGVVDGNPPQDAECDYDNSGAVGMADYDAWLQCYRVYLADPTAAPPGPGPGDNLKPTGQASEIGVGRPSGISVRPGRGAPTP